MIEPLTFTVTSVRRTREATGTTTEQHLVELTQTGGSDKLKMKPGAVLALYTEDEDTVKQLTPAGDFTLTITPAP